MIDSYTDIPSKYVHHEVRLRIVNKEIVESARRIFELCESIGINPDSVSETWKKEDIGIEEIPFSDEFGDADIAIVGQYDNKPVFRVNKAIATGGNKMQRLQPLAESLEYHVKKHALLLAKAKNVAEEKLATPRDWHSDGHFHWCPNCDQVFGCDTPNKDGEVCCSFCGTYGTF